MSENSSHGPGSGTDFAGERQRHMMGENKGVMRGGDFGIAPLPGHRRIEGEAINGKELSDKERGTPPHVNVGKNRMPATAACDHGPHGHQDRR